MEGKKSLLSNFDRPAIMDGDMAGVLMKFGLPPDERALYCAPDTVREIYREYIEAGAQIISTLTSGANRFTLRDNSCEHTAYETALLGAGIARSCSGGALVAGTVGQLPRANLRKREITSLYKPVIHGLTEGGADFIHLRGFTKPSHVECILNALQALHCDLPVMLTFRMPKSADVCPMEEFFARIPKYDWLALGICGCYGRGGTAACRTMRGLTDRPVVFCRDIEQEAAAAVRRDRSHMLALTLSPSIKEGLADIAGGNIGCCPESIAGLATVAHFSRLRNK